ncbi:hypothetical protein [Hydrotalea sp.]|uniref:hypothetical protein n=2 Tax=Hydrotalea sp. TaxID=2881279 RepID=UPI00263263C4|nr:hypothetical protein [Hydrotalea sp.]
MKYFFLNTLLFITLIAIGIHSQAQVYRDRIGFDLESIANIDIGWMTIRKHTEAPKGKQLGNRTYSAKQIGYSQKFVEWMQQSYLPKGCLGDATYYQNYIPKFSPTNSLLGNAINTHAHALPLMYGAQTKIYMFLKKDAQGKFVPQNNLGDYWHIEANQLQYISNPVSFISSPEEYYFILPDYSSHSNGYNADDKAASNLMGFANHKNITGYKHFYIPHSQYIVIITKNNEALPFEKINIGEFFTEAEKQFPEWQKVTPVSAENYAKAQKNLARLKEKYKSKWNNIAEMKLSKTQITLQTFVNATEGYDDIFDTKDIYGKEGNYTSFPILKVKKTTKELCKTNQPQWLVIRWTMSMPNQPYNIHLHESILNNFNFDYVYNFFFDPEKIKNQTYKPLRFPSYKEVAVVTDASEASKKNNADKNVFFFEDFSTTVVGKIPIGWKSKLGSAGSSSVITNLDGLDGNWAVVADYTVTPGEMKKPLPQNFTLSYDVVVAQNFTWGAKQLHFKLAKETSPGTAESFLDLGIRPGYDGRDGDVSLETKFPSPPGYSNGSNTFVAPGFSNNKKNNRITVTIKKKEEMLQVLIDNTKTAEYEKAIPAAHLFNALSFYSYNPGANDKYYISNIKITKN